MSEKQYAKMYRSWFNDFITVDGFAEYYGVDRSEAESIIEHGRMAHERGH